jgi:aquaporin NIP
MGIPVREEKAVAGLHATLQKLGAEAIGTFALVFAGCGAIMVNEQTGGTVTHLGVGIVFGMVIMVMVYATGHISGAHFNPAVTTAFAVAGRFRWKQVPAYLFAQIVGGTIAAFALSWTIGDFADVGATRPSIGEGSGFIIEVILTFFLMFVITAVATDSRAVGHMAGLAIGATVGLASIFAGPLTGASMNPARSLGPALASQSFETLWIYLTAPFVGAALGALAYRSIQCGDTPQNADGCC